jgi:hypothetical protein
LPASPDYLHVKPAHPRKRAAAYIAKMGPAVQGQHGDDHTYKVACALVVDFALPEPDALDIMREWNTTCVPPWKDGDLIKKLRGAAKYGRHVVGGKLDGAKPRLTSFDTPREALSALVHALFDRAPSDVIGWLLSELADTARWTRSSQNGPDPAKIPRAHRMAALLAAVGAYVDAVATDLEAEPGAEPIAPADEDCVRWIMEETARQHFACVPSLRVKRDEVQCANDSLDRMQNWTRTKSGARHAPRVLPYALQRPVDPETLVARQQEVAHFRASLSPLEREVLDGYGKSDKALSQTVGSDATTAKTVKSTRGRIRAKAKAWGVAAVVQGVA